jgi:1-acyl-sn-glycerol-3-phosphate acyltransferase
MGSWKEMICLPTPFLYRIARIVMRVAAVIYFKRLEISGAEHIPSAGPTILAANHPQSITDGLVLALGAGRMVHYLGHSGLFKKKWRAWLLRNLGAIPVHRPRDVEDAASKNIEMFAACERLLERGGAIGIFPEGVSAEERHVQRLRTGAARIGLQSEAKSGWTLGVVIIPVGLNFESHRRMRTRVLLRFGEPIAPARYLDAYERYAGEAVNALTEALKMAIHRLVVNIERPRFEELVRDVEDVYKSDLLARQRVAIPGPSKFKKDQLVSQEIPKALDFFLDRKPEVVWRVATLLKEYRRKLERLRLRDEMLREEKEATVHGEMTRFLVLGAIGFPIAAYGALWNFVPYKLTGWMARRTAKDSTKIHYNQLTQGTAIYLLYYAGLLYLAYRPLEALGVTIFAATLPPTGLFAHAYTRYMVRRQRMLRFAFFRLTHGYYAQKIRQQRQHLISEMDGALEEYVTAQRTLRKRGAETHSDRDPQRSGRGDDTG